MVNQLDEFIGTLLANRIDDVCSIDRYTPNGEKYTTEGKVTRVFKDNSVRVVSIDNGKKISESYAYCGGSPKGSRCSALNPNMINQSAKERFEDWKRNNPKRCELCYYWQFKTEKDGKRVGTCSRFSGMEHEALYFSCSDFITEEKGLERMAQNIVDLFND